jgi:hypothetical protein
MSKTITSLLFASGFVSGLCVTPLLTGAAVQFASAGYAAEEQAPAPCIYEETDMATASETNADIAGGTPTRGTAMVINPVLEITQDLSDNVPSKALAIAQEPEVTESVASFAPSEEDTVQTLAAAPHTANGGQMISGLDDMNGKVVIDQNGELMGSITNVDYEADLAEVELTNGSVIGLMMHMLTELDNGLVAADLTDEDAFATAEQ